MNAESEAKLGNELNRRAGFDVFYLRFRIKFPSALLALTAIVGSANVAHATVTLTGVALNGVPGVAAGDTAVFLADYNNEGFLSLNVPFFAPLAENSTYGNFRVLGVKTASLGLSGGIVVSGSITNIPYDDELGAGDAFAVLVFSYSTTSTIPDDSYTIWTDPTWVLPPDGMAISFSNSSTGAFKQFRATDAPFRVGFVQSNVLDPPLPVMPEPVSFSAVAGGLGLALAGLRRRRRV